MSKSPIDKALTPETFKNLKTKTPPTNSAGLQGLKAASSHAIKYIKPSNILKISTKLNQKGGFDCLGCAWPDPDDEPFTYLLLCFIIATKSQTSQSSQKKML